MAKRKMPAAPAYISLFLFILFSHGCDEGKVVRGGQSQNWGWGLGRVQGDWTCCSILQLRKEVQ